jgi:hypothetical protein
VFTARVEDGEGMTASGGSPHGQEQAARRLLERTAQRAALNEAVGILQAWQACGRQQARDDLDHAHGLAGQDAEARRVIAVVDAAADGRADPDGDWR